MGSNAALKSSVKGVSAFGLISPSGLATANPANTLNQYATYQTPSTFDILGQAPAGCTVTVNGIAATFQDTFFRADVPTANSGANGVWQSVAVTNNGVTTTGNLYIPPASFTPTYFDARFS